MAGHWAMCSRSFQTQLGGETGIWDTRGPESGSDSIMQSEGEKTGSVVMTGSLGPTLRPEQRAAYTGWGGLLVEQVRTQSTLFVSVLLSFALQQ